MDRQAIEWSCHAYLKSADGASAERAIQHLRSAIADPDMAQAARELQASLAELRSNAARALKGCDVLGNSYTVHHVVQFAKSVQLMAGSIEEFLKATLQSAGVRQ